MADADRLAIAREAVEAFNAADWSRSRALLTPDSVYDEKGSQRLIEGADAIIDAQQAWKQAFPDVAGTITNAVDTGESVLLELTWQGTHTGPLETPGGAIPASGKQVKIPAAWVLSFEGDKIGESHHYFDMMTMLQQIEAVPAPA